MFFGSSITSMAATLLAVLLAITLHELAHGYVAYCLGDNTAKAAGRLTLNPLAHLDPIGALMMLIAGFGWAKPVPVNPFFFKGNRTTGMMLVSLAGPLVNLIVAYIAYAVYESVPELLYYFECISGSFQPDSHSAFGWL